MEHHSRPLMQGLREVGFVGYWERDFETGMMRTSPELAAFYGLANSGDDVEQLRYIDLEATISADDVPRIDQWRRQGIDPAGIGSIEYRVPDHGGNVRWVLCRASYRRDENGHILHGRGVIFDVTPSRTAASGQPESGILSPVPTSADILNRLADLLLEARRLAELLGDETLIQGVGLNLLRTGWLIAQRRGPAMTP